MSQRSSLSSTPSQSKMTTSRKRRVTLNPNVTIVETLHLDDFTPSEIAASWFDEQECEQITQKCFKVLKKMECGKGQKYCTRGLEGHTTLGSIQKKNARTASFVAVLEEQNRQLSENAEYDAQAIADAYRRTTSSCQMWAQVVGNRDQRAVEEYLYPEDEVEIVRQSDPTVECLTSSPVPERERQAFHKTGPLQSCARAA